MKAQFRRLPSAIGRLSIIPLSLSLIMFAGTFGAVAAPGEQDQWHLDRIGIPEAHSISKGKGVLIGMFAAPSATDVVGLGGRVRPVKQVGRAGRANDGTDRPRLDIDVGRLGLIVADGELGVLGVAPEAEIQPTLPDRDTADATAALRWLVDEGAKVIDLTRAVKPRAPLPVEGIRYAVANDVVVVANATSASRRWPLHESGVLMVGATTRRDRSAHGSDRVHVVAPGDEVGMTGLSVHPDDDGTGWIRGNSVWHAAAIAAGIAALVRAAHPELSAPEVIKRLLFSAEDLGSEGWDEDFGHGMLDPHAALTSGPPPTPTANARPETGLSDVTVAPVARKNSAENTLQLLFGSAMAVLGFFLLVGTTAVLLRRAKGRPSPPGDRAGPAENPGRPSVTPSRD